MKEGNRYTLVLCIGPTTTVRGYTIVDTDTNT